MTVPADFSIPTKVLFIDHTFVFSFIISLLLMIIEIMGVCSERL